ncbi:MAG: Tim44/TimA family putative adaptor protein [Alphaproteobacteria bacterium]
MHRIQVRPDRRLPSRPAFVAGPPDQRMMNDVFDIFNLFFLVLAIVVFLKLRSVLGRRTGHERPPFKPVNTGKPANDDNVVALPGAAKAAPTQDNMKRQSAQTAAARWPDIAPTGSPLASGLTKLANADPNFDPDQFLDGARAAYEMIVTAFAQGDTDTLENLLSATVYDGFAAAIAGREERGETIKSSFVGIEEAHILEAKLVRKIARITVKFKSELISVTRNAKGKRIEGDPKKIREVTDVWTFERDAASLDPNWRLAATESAN